MSLITWRGRQEDPIVLWGQLLAYMPQIVVNFAPRVIIRLPGARLQPRDHVTRPDDLARQRKVRDGVSFPERKAAALLVMREQLTARGEHSLHAQLDQMAQRRPTRKAAKRAVDPGKRSVTSRRARNVQTEIGE